MATYMKDQYKKNLGADLDVEIVTFDAALDRVDAEDYQINYSFGWIGDYDDPMTFMDLYLSDSPFNNSFFENEEYDRLIKEAQTTSDLQLRMQNMLKAERILIEQAATVPVYFAVFAGVRKPYFKGYTRTPLWRRRLQVRGRSRESRKWVVLRRGAPPLRRRYAEVHAQASGQRLRRAVHHHHGDLVSHAAPARLAHSERREAYCRAGGAGRGAV